MWRSPASGRYSCTKSGWSLTISSRYIYTYCWLKILILLKRNGRSTKQSSNQKIEKKNLETNGGLEYSESIYLVKMDKAHFFINLSLLYLYLKRRVRHFLLAYLMPLKGLFTNFEYITFFSCPTKRNIFCKRSISIKQLRNEVFEKIGCSKSVRLSTIIYIIYI